MSMTLKATCPEDVLAAVPVVLGFAPEDSLVMLTFGAREQFHARIDLPHSHDHVEDCVAAVLRPALIHGVRSVFFVQYAADEVLARRLARRLAQRFERAGIEVLDSIRAHDGRWFAAVPRRDVPPEGIAYDVSGHAFRASAVFDGRVTLESRAAVAARVATDHDLVLETERSLAVASPLTRAGVVGLLSRCLRFGRVANTDDLAALLLALCDPVIREQAWRGVHREDAVGHVALWCDVVRRCPERLVAHPAAILALVAWLAGDGALAWCALDRCFAADPDHRLAVVVAQMLTEAVSPSSWDTGETAHGETVASGG